jgi:hypothetical protein
MIDVYAAAGTLSEKHKLPQDLANAVMRWEKVPPLNLFARLLKARKSFSIPAKRRNWNFVVLEMDIPNEASVNQAVHSNERLLPLQKFILALADRI